MTVMLDYLWINIKTIFRIPLSVFFSVAYPILMMIIMMVSYGNPDIGEGYQLIDKYLMVAIGMGILPLTLISFPIWIAADIEDNSLKRMLYFKVKFSKIIISEVLAHMLVSVVCIVIDIIFAKILYGLRIPQFTYLFAFFIQYMIAVAVCILLGAVLAILISNTQVIMPLGLFIMFALYMLCGAFVSYDQLPERIHKISGCIPMKYAMNNFIEIWMQKKYFDMDFILLSSVYTKVLLIMFGNDYNKKYYRWKVNI